LAFKLLSKTEETSSSSQVKIQVTLFGPEAAEFKKMCEAANLRSAAAALQMMRHCMAEAKKDEKKAG
jgi:hypothetical protein